MKTAEYLLLCAYFRVTTYPETFYIIFRFYILQQLFVITFIFVFDVYVYDDKKSKIKFHIYFTTWKLAMIVFYLFTMEIL